MKRAGPTSRWDVARLGLVPRARARARWRSPDLSGPLPARVARNLFVAIQSLPVRGPWPEVDEEDWWVAVLNDPRLRPPSAKRVAARHDTGFRLDHCPAKALTFTCTACGAAVTFPLSELLKTFGGDRNVRTIGLDVIKCPQRRARREGNECPIIYGA